MTDDKKECEIEDLFEKTVLKTEIDGRTFLKEVEKGDTKHYCKDVFSKYVYENYRTINFDKFKLLLDNINNIILNHKI